MTDKNLTLTPRKVEALEAALYGQPANYRKSGKRNDGTIFWTTPHGGGGASMRMVRELKDAGLIITSARGRISDELDVRWRDMPDMPEALKTDKGGLSVAGLEALDAHLRSGRRYDPTDVRLQMIKDQLAKRRELDVAYEAFMTDRRDAEKAAYARKREAQAKALVVDVRGVLVRAGLGQGQLQMSDDDVRQLVRDLSDAQHGLSWVRYLDDADLSAELNATEKDTQTPGTVGHSLRHEKLLAIRAEFARRAAE